MRSPTSHSPTRRPFRVAAGILRALVSLVALLALLTALPWLLWEATWAAVPAGLEDLTHLLSRQDTSGAFILALAVVGWISWTGFTLSLLVEIPAQLRGRTAPSLPGFRLGQRAAATLVGSILVLLPTGTAMASSAAASPAVSAEQVPGQSELAATVPEQADRDVTGQVAATSRAASAQREYTVRDVRPAESLWQIAESELGNGERYTDIVDLNEGRTMTDGSVFHADEPVKPGWTLLLPAAPAAPGVHASQHGPATQLAGTRQEADDSYTVEPGDYLSKIAQDELGDGNRWTELYNANRDQIRDPDLIHPGQQLALPAQIGHTEPNTPDEPAAPVTPSQPADEAPDGRGDQAQPEGSGVAQTAAPSHAAPSRPDETAQDGDQAAPGRSTNGTPTSKASAPPASNPATPPAANSADEASSGTTRQAALVVGIGALLAASLAGALGVKRILQQRRRHAGETIAIDADPTAMEQVLHASAGPAGVALLDTALRTLAHHAHAAGRELPAVRGARVTDRMVQLLLDDPSTELLPPFAAGDKPGTWVGDPGCLLLDGDAAREVPAPYPGLVTLGAAEDGALLLANLLHTGALLLDGDADDVLAVARALALEAGTCSWSDHTEIVTVGLGTRLATLLPKGRVRTMQHLPSAVADLGTLLVEVHQNSGIPDSAPEPLPWILICAGDVDAEQAWQLADAVSGARDLPVTVVLPADEATRQAFPDAEQIAVAPDIQIALPHLGSGPVQLQRLTDDQYRQYVHALDVADQPAKPATGAWQLAEDRILAATELRPAPHPLLLHNTNDDGEGEGEGPGSPFPALLASAVPSPIRLVKPKTAADDDGANPDQTATGPANAAPSADGSPVVPQAESEVTPDAPEVAVLGPLRVTGTTGSGHGPKVAALAALIRLRPGRTADTLCSAMDPVSPWSTRTLQSRLSEIRSRFGSAPDGEPYLPRPKPGYVFHSGVRSDWDRFQHLAARGLAAGPAAGIPELEDALGLVRGKPFDGQDYPWADSVQQEMLSRIVDVAHTLAAWHAESDAPDLDAARQAALRGLDIDETAEVLYRDWMHIEWAAGNTAGVRKAVARVQQVTRFYDISMEQLTEHAIDLVLSERPAPAHAGRA